MELLAHILYFLANRGVVLFVFSMFFTIAAVSIASHWHRHYLKKLSGQVAPKLLLNVGAAACYAMIFGLLAFSAFNIFRPHGIDGYLINLVGRQADAVVTNVEPTWNRLNNRTVHKHSIVFKTAAGENIETYFHTWDFNVYPSANSTTYPQKGENFKVLYLPSFPTTFLIMTAAADSPHNKAVACAELEKALDAARIKHEFDRKDPKFKTALDEAEQRVIDARCRTPAVDESSF